MSNSKALHIKIALTLIVLLGAYFIVALLDMQRTSNILALLVDFAVGGTLFFAYRHTKREIKGRKSLLLFAIGCIIWGLGDGLWGLMDLFGADPVNSLIANGIYVLTNCLFLAATVLFAFQQFRKWDLVQFCIDLVVSSFMVVVMAWILFFREDTGILNAVLSSDLASIISIITDIMICICVFTWFLSVRNGNIPVFIRIISFGLFLFSFSDIFYYYMNYNALYLPNALNDLLYTASLVTIALGALWRAHKKSQITAMTVIMNTGGRSRWVFLLLYPGITFLFTATGIVDYTMGLWDCAAFAIPIVLYWASCKYVQVSLEKEALLTQSNKVLAQRVAEQVSELTFLANQDTLTTLFNRRYFMTQLEETMRRKHAGDLVALLIIDMDRFKTINDTFGHDVGDRVLIDLSQRMIEWNTCSALISRLGGDEFAVMIVGSYTQQDIEAYCSSIIDVCCEPFVIGENELRLSMSAGIALASTDIADGKTLMQNADIAMYRAKSQGYNKYQVYDAFMSQDFKKAAEIEVLLRKTDAEKDFELFFQPQYALPGKELIGAER